MNFLIDFFNLILYRPLLNSLILLYQYLPGHDFGLSVILLTVLIRLILYPLMSQSLKSQKALSGLQLKIQEIQKKYVNDKEKQAKEMIGLYQKEKINPFSGLILVFLQLPILIALYQVFWKGLRPEEMVNLYSFVAQPERVNPTFLGLVNLAEASLVLAILAGIIQFFQTKLTLPQKEKGAEKTNPQFSDIFQKQMIYFLPVFTILILLRMPAAISLYWIVTSLFSIIQQYFIFKKI
jgi:YidC/Oxa1 family membrane protein insertase